MTLSREEQIYRIDHYLGKDMIRNILTIRFSNRLFTDSWNGASVERVDVTSIETTGVEERLDYYDRAGAINDMVQSHLLQMVALVAMAAPAHLGPEAIRQAKIDVLRRITVDDRFSPVIGQYQGYDALRPGSTIETYVEATLRIDTEQWQGTRFVIRTGKKLAEKDRDPSRFPTHADVAPVARKPSRPRATGSPSRSSQRKACNCVSTPRSRGTAMTSSR